MSKKSVREHFEILSSEALSQANDETDLRVTQEAAKKVKEIGRALAEGKMPTTEQAETAMNKARLNNIQNANLSETGQQVLQQMDQAFATTTKMVGEKNKGDHLQHMIQNSKSTASGVKEGTFFTQSKSKSAEHAKDAKKLLNEGGSNVSLVARLIVTSSQFRHLMGDFYQVFEQVISQVSQDSSSNLTSADNSRPTSKNLSTKELRDEVVLGPVKKSQLEQDSAQKHGVHSQTDNKQDQQNFSNKGIQSNSDSMQKHHETQPLTVNNELYNSLSKDNILKSNSSGLQNLSLDKDQLLNKSKESSTEASKKIQKSIVDNVKSNMDQTSKGDISKLPEEAQNAAREVSNDFKQRIQNISLSPETQDKLTERFKNLCTEVQSDQQYKDAFINLTNIIKQLSEKTKDYSQDITGIAVKETASKEGMTEIASHSRQIIENFAGGNSMQPMIDSIKRLANKAEKDPEFRKYFSEAKQFIVNSMTEPEFIEEENYNEKARELIKETRHYLTTNYKEDTNDFLDKSKKFNSALQEDPTTNKFIKDFESLGRTLFLDEEGKPTVKKELVDDIKKIIPLIGERLKLMRLPRIEHEDEKVHIILDNVVLQCSEILPRSVYIRTDTEFDINDDHMLNAVTTKIRNINGAAKKVAFYVKVKKGMVKPEEAGYIDVDLPKQGITIDVTLSPPSVNLNKSKTNSNSLDSKEKKRVNEIVRDQTNNEYIQVLRSKCRVHDIKIKLYDTNYPQFIYKMFSGVINNLARKKLEEGINDGVKQMFNQLNAAATRSFTPRSSQDTSRTQTNTETIESGTHATSNSGQKNWKSDAFNV